MIFFKMFNYLAKQFHVNQMEFENHAAYYTMIQR